MPIQGRVAALPNTDHEKAKLEQRRSDRRQVEHVAPRQRLHFARCRDQRRRPVVEDAFDGALRLRVGEAALARISLTPWPPASRRSRRRDLGRERSRRPRPKKKRSRVAAVAAQRPGRRRGGGARPGAARRQARARSARIALLAQSRLTTPAASEQRGARQSRRFCNWYGFGGSSGFDSDPYRRTCEAWGCVAAEAGPAARAAEARAEARGSLHVARRLSTLRSPPPPIRSRAPSLERCSPTSRSRSARRSRSGKCRRRRAPAHPDRRTIVATAAV